MSELRDRMRNVMCRRGMAARTQEAYVAALVELAKYYHRSPADLRVEEVQAYLPHLMRDKKLADASVNQASCAFRFLYRRVLGRPEAGYDLPMAKVPKRLPQILSREEVACLLAHDGVVYAKQPLGGPEQVLEYLGRYTYRLAISNERLVGMDDNERPLPRASALRPMRAGLAGGGVHRPLPAARPVGRFQADSARWPAGAGGEGDEARTGAAGFVGADTRSGDHGDGGGLPAARRRDADVRVMCRVCRNPTA